MATEGFLDGKALIDVLRALQRRTATGILTVQGEAEIIAFSLLEGEVVSADALNQSLEDGLGEVLVREGLIEADDFGGLVSEYQSGGGRVTDLLLERSFLSREQLLGALRRQTYRLCRQTLTWKEGEYRFYQGDEVAYEPDVVPLGIDELLVRAADDLGDAGPYGSEIADESERYAPILGASSSAQLPNAVLEEERAQAETLYRALDGQRPLVTVADEAGIPVFTARALVSHWLACGLVEATAKEPPAAAPVEEPPLAEPLPGPVADLGLEAMLPSTGEIEAAIAPEAPALENLPAAPARRRAKRREVSSWPPRVMGVALFLAVLAVLISAPARLLLPFPWQGGLRDAFDSERQVLSLFRIDRAATSFFLLEGRYPEDLSLLVADRLLAAEDLVDRAGRRLEFSSGPASYFIQTGSGEDSQNGLARAISENFLLDPQFLVVEQTLVPPLVLLD